MALLAFLGEIGGVAAGLLGFGGGIIMLPLLYYVPPLLGLSQLNVKTVAAVVISQVFFSTLIGGWVHSRHGRVHKRLVIVAGVLSTAGSLAGAIGSKWLPEQWVLVLFGLVSLSVALMMVLPMTIQQEEMPADKIDFSLTHLSLVSCAAGVVVGLLGAGNFIFVPVLVYVLKIPTRVAIGSSLLIALMNTSGGFLGKLITAQIPFALTLAVVIGASTGVLLGERLHGRFSIPTLNWIYAGIVWLITIRVWITLLLPIN